MTKFIIKVTIFLLVISLVYALPLAIYFVSKDYMSTREVVDSQLRHPESLVGFSYFGERNVEYKKILLEKKQPEVIALGSSRTFQLRQEFFLKPEQFVNAAVPRPAIGNFINFKNLLDSTSNNTKEKVVIVLLDKRYFTERYDTSTDANGDSFILKFSHLIGKPLRLLYLDYFSGKYAFGDLVLQSKHTNNIGLWALVRDSGFRVDGSVKEGYETKIPNRLAVLQGDINSRVAEIKNYSPILLQKEQNNIIKNTKDLDEFLLYCKNHTIKVVGFIPPDPIEVSHEIKLEKNSYSKEQVQLVNTISKIFHNRGYSVYDLSDIALYGGRDEEFIDLIHGGDLLYAKMLLYLANHDKTVMSVVNREALRTMIQSSKGDFLDF